jgi:hypothetical protein
LDFSSKNLPWLKNGKTIFVKQKPTILKGSSMNMEIFCVGIGSQGKKKEKKMDEKTKIKMEINTLAALETEQTLVTLNPTH